jgi:hypothetical protein
VRPNPQLQLLHVTAALLALLLALPRAHGCPLRVLAFGDSLTEGLYLDPASGQHGFHSYALRLRELLRDALPAGCHVVVHERGRSGEKVVPAMQVSLWLRAVPRTEAACHQTGVALMRSSSWARATWQCPSRPSPLRICGC